MRLFLSPQDTCSYLPDRQAASLFVDPAEALDMSRYGALVRAGFRRSGRYVYRPHCDGCQACVAARIPVAHFRPNRSQRRNARANRDLLAARLADIDTPVQYQRYIAYQQRRHPGGSMAQTSAAEFRAFLTADWADTEFREFQLAGEALGLCVFDRLQDGLSAVYTYYSAAGEQRGLGKYAVLWLVEEARRRGLTYVYLGYWIAGCAKMAYKAEFRALEVLSHGRWRRYRG